MNDVLKRWIDEAVPVMGWPEWVGGRYPKRMGIDSLGEVFVVICQNGEPFWGDEWMPDDHEALCILREHARAWLVDKAWIAPDRIRGDVQFVAFREPYDKTIGWYDSYDSALIAAVVACRA